MRRQLLIIGFIVLGPFANSQLVFDILHYRYEIDLNDKNDTIYGRAKITFSNYFRAGSTIQLKGLNPTGKGMIIDSIFISNSRRFNPAPKYELNFRNDTILVGYPEKPWTSSLTDTSELMIYYHGIPADGLIISKNKYGEKTFFADNWPNRAHFWIPCVDRPDDKAGFEFIVTAPSQYSVISNGAKIEEKDIGNGKKLTHWKETIPLPTKIMVIGVARFAVKTYADSPPNIPVSAWVYAQDSTAGFKNYSLAPAILKYLTNYIGSYPYNKLANVQSKTIYGGMENASAIFYPEESATSGISVEVLAHEIAHQWFGDMATEKSFPHLWLSEGFADYFSHLYMESRSGIEKLKDLLKEAREKIIGFASVSNNPVVDSVTPVKELLNANSYDKGAWFLHMLRRQVGDSVFQKIIRSYYTSFAGKNAETRDFQRVCEKESGKDLQSFFDQWLYTPGVPKIEFKWKYDSQKKTVSTTIHQAQNDVFRFPLEIQLRSASGKARIEKLNVTTQDQTFTIMSKERIVKVTLDPNVNLLFEED